MVAFFQYHNELITKAIPHWESLSKEGCGALFNYMILADKLQHSAAAPRSSVPSQIRSSSNRTPGSTPDPETEGCPTTN